MYLKDRLRSFRYAWQGLLDLFRTQPNARIHLGVALLVTLAGAFFDLSRGEWALVVLCFAAVVSLEAMNTALEYLADALMPERHPLVGKAKDAAAAAVLIGAIGSVAVGLLIFVPKIYALLLT